MTVKKLNTNTEPKGKPKKEMPPIVTYYQEYHLDLFSMGKMPVTVEYLRKFATEWVERAEMDEDMVTLWDFPTKKRVTPDRVWDWMKRCPELSAAKEIVTSIVGDRREKGAIKKKYDASSVFRNQHHYCAMDKASEEWRSDLKSKQAQSGAATGPITVVMEKFTTENVSKLKKKDNRS